MIIVIEEWKVCGSGHGLFKVSQYFPRKTEENHKKAHSG
jgi:hypothetical protein